MGHEFEPCCTLRDDGGYEIDFDTIHATRPAAPRAVATPDRVPSAARPPPVAPCSKHCCSRKRMSLKWRAFGHLRDTQMPRRLHACTLALLTAGRECVGVHFGPPTSARAAPRIPPECTEGAGLVFLFNTAQ